MGPPHIAGAKIQNSASYKLAAEPTFSSFFYVCKYLLLAYLLSWLNDWQGCSGGGACTSYCWKFISVSLCQKL